ncbi:MAG: hypothetical protein ACYS14_05290, partial [Planctomycetota bacterium]
RSRWRSLNIDANITHPLHKSSENPHYWDAMSNSDLGLQTTVEELRSGASTRSTGATCGPWLPIG